MNLHLRRFNIRELVKILIIILLWAITLPSFSQQPVSTFSCHVHNISFADFAKVIYDKTGSQVFYKDEWVRDITVTIEKDSISVQDALVTAMGNSGLRTSEWNGHYIILPGEELISRLPEWPPPDISTDSSIQENLPGEERSYLEGRRADLLNSITIGKKSAGKVRLARINGRIVDLENGEPIVGATVFIRETSTGAVSDLRGYLNLTLRPGKYTAQFECMGYQKTTCQLDVISAGSFSIGLAKAVIALEEAVIYGDRQMSVTLKDPGIEKITVRSIKEIPMMLGERDIIKVSEMLPGIVSVGEGAAGLNVRGGNFDQNAFYINNVPVYNTSHFFGFYPAFNADIINDFTIYKGYIPARFGGRLSSVFDIATKQGNKKHFALHGGINPFAGNITVESPLVNDSCSILVSGRSSYSDWVLSRMNDYNIRNSSAGFYDVTSLLSIDLKKTNIDLFFYHSSDYFKLADLSSYEYSNLGTSLGINRRITTKVKNSFSLAASRYAYGTIDKQEPSKAYQHSYQLDHYELRNDITHTLSEKHTLNYGLDLTLYRLDRGTVEPFGPESERMPVPHGQEQGFEGAVYLTDIFDVLPWMKIYGGLRYVRYSCLGPGDVFVYQNPLLRDTRYITDTLSFRSNAFIKTYNAPEFRLALNFETDPSGSVKLSFNQMDQNLFMLSNTIALAPNTQWKLADYHLNPSRCNQYSFGVFRNFFNNTLESSVEVYYKSINNFPEFRDGANFLFSPAVETEVLQGKQKSYGFEFFVKLNNRKADGWIAYTWSRSLIQVNGTDIWNRINNGMVYPSNYDIPNALNTIFNYHFSKRITASSVLCYQTGKPVTYPLSVYYFSDLPYTDFSERNEYRIPDYFRIDLSVNIEGSLKVKKLFHSSWQFGIYNLTGRRNAYSVYFKSEKGRLNSYKYSIIGTQLFTASWLIKIGNFATN